MVPPNVIGVQPGSVLIINIAVAWVGALEKKGKCFAPAPRLEQLPQKAELYNKCERIMANMMNRNLKLSLPRDRIISAARLLFSRQGFHSTSIANISQLAGTSIGNIYRIFENKTEIIGAIVMHDTASFMADLEADIKRVEEGRMNPMKALDDVFSRHVAGADGALFHEILAESHRSTVIRDAIAEFSECYQFQLSRLVGTLVPSLSEIDARETAGLIHLALIGFGSHDLIGKPLQGDTKTLLIECLLASARSKRLSD